jgi:hypothetical protein
MVINLVNPFIFGFSTFCQCKYVFFVIGVQSQGVGCGKHIKVNRLTVNAVQKA